MELNLYFLAPLLQCTSIDRCALFMRAKKNNNILLNFSLPFHLKNIFSFFLFLSLASLLSSFFLLIFFSLPHLYSLLHRCQSTPTLPTHSTGTPQTPAANPFRPYLIAFFFFPLVVGCGVVVVVVVWVDRRQWVAGFIGGWLGGWAMGGFVGRSVCSWW